jgi:KipI family sensor histidine kinase inhibitor
VRLLPYGDEALLAEPEDPATVLALVAALRDEPGVREVVPAARTLLVRAAAGDLARVGARLRELATTAGAGACPADGPQVTLDVHYDGLDLDETAAQVGLEPDGLVRAHTAGSYVVAFCGFTPGFAYLTGLDAALHVPRLAQPRTRVPAGSVGIAGEFTGVYPRSSPGGWRLLGRTDADLWDLARTPPALLAPGTRVRFRSA